MVQMLVSILYCLTVGVIFSQSVKLLFKKRSELNEDKKRRGSQGYVRSQTSQDQPDFYWSDQDEDGDYEDDDDVNENNLIILVMYVWLWVCV